jgi:hypothetical protein
VKPAMKSAANTHASRRITQPAAVSQAAAMLVESLLRSQSALATVVPTGIVCQCRGVGDAWRAAQSQSSAAATHRPNCAFSNAQGSAHFSGDY